MSFTKCLSNVLMQIRHLLSERLLQLQTFLPGFHQLMLSCNRSPWVHGLSSTEGFKRSSILCCTSFEGLPFWFCFLLNAQIPSAR